MPTKSLTMYWLPHCTTCMKAAQYIRQKGYTNVELRDIKTDPLTRDEVEQLVKLVGSADELFSRRARKYRSMNLADRELSNEEMLKLMTDEYTFIKRPVLIKNGKAVAGFTPKTYDAFLDAL